MLAQGLRYEHLIGNFGNFIPFLSLWVVLSFHRWYCLWFISIYLSINFYPEKYYSVTLFFKGHLFQVCWDQLLVIHLDLKKHNVFRKKNTCKEDLNNVASVHKQELVKLNRGYCFQNNSLPFYLCRFFSRRLCCVLSRFSNKKYKLQTAPSEKRKYFIHFIHPRFPNDQYKLQTAPSKKQKYFIHFIHHLTL